MVTLADISASNAELTTVALVLAIIALFLWIISWVIARGR